MIENGKKYKDSESGKVATVVAKRKIIDGEKQWNDCLVIFGSEFEWIKSHRLKGLDKNDN